VDVLSLPPARGLWSPLDVVASTGSTNADLLAAAAAGAPEGRVLVAEEQTAGRGRLGRSWASVPGASLTFSVLLRPASVPQARRGWLPLLAGLAVAAAVRSAAGLDAVLKWPNDVLLDERKLAGILAEQSPDGAAVVVGIGLNAATPADALPLPAPGGLAPTSLLAAGAAVPRAELLLAVLDQFERWYKAFRADPDPRRSGLLDAYRPLCATLGTNVRVSLPSGRELAGRAVDVDAAGHLLVAARPGDPPVPVSAGDVIHVRW
jgi:BirA family transcriptional regulator, biotin operon repressor / biotin---[acetyl-CoA-carboxylase] ligase